MAIQDDRQMLLREVLRYPEDNTPRLVYADWLVAHAEHFDNSKELQDQARFIRMSIKRREEKPLVHGLGSSLQKMLQRYPHWAEPAISRRKDVKIGDWIVRWTWDRGFISTIHCSLSEIYLTTHPWLLVMFDRHPIERVYLSCRYPTSKIEDDYAGWSFQSVIPRRDWVPLEIRRRMAYWSIGDYPYLFAKSATEDLARAAANYIRSLFQFPDLPPSHNLSMELEV